MAGLQTRKQASPVGNTSPCRLLGDSTNLYQAPDDATMPIRTLSKGEVVYLGAQAKGPNDTSYVTAATLDGVQGYSRGDVQVMRIKVSYAAAPNMPIHAQPDPGSAITFTLKNKAPVVLTDQVTGSDGQLWVGVRTADGRAGYVTGNSKFIDGDKVPAPKTDILVGALWCIGGIIATVIGYNMASGDGGTYMVFWGAIIFGGLQFCKGCINALTSIGKPNPRRMVEEYMRSLTGWAAGYDQGYYARS